MNKNKKFPILLTSLGLLATSLVVFPTILTSCSSKNNKEPNLNNPNQSFSENFNKIAKNLKEAPEGVDVNQYNFLFNYIHKTNQDSSTLINQKMDTLNTLNSGFTQQNLALEYATELLNNLDIDTIAKVLLINFNKESFLSKINTEIQLKSEKSFYTLKDINYNSENKNLSFSLNYNYTCIDENNIPNYNTPLINLYSIQTTIEFNNLTLIPSVFYINNLYIPTFSIEQNDNIEIKYINSDININVKEFYSQQLNYLNWDKQNNNLSDQEYNYEINQLYDQVNYFNQILTTTNNISNWDFNNLSFSNINNNDIFKTPFMQNQILTTNNEYNQENKYWLTYFNIGVAQVKYNPNYNNNGYWIDFVTSNFGIPLFNFINFNEDNFDFIFSQS